MKEQMGTSEPKSTGTIFPVEKIGEIVKEKESVKESHEKERDDVLKTKVEDLNISARILKALGENKIRTIGGLVKKSDDDLKEMSGIGDKGVKEVKKSLGKLGLTLRNV